MYISVVLLVSFADFCRMKRIFVFLSPDSGFVESAGNKDWYLGLSYSSTNDFYDFFLSSLYVSLIFRPSWVAFYVIVCVQMSCVFSVCVFEPVCVLFPIPRHCVHPPVWLHPAPPLMCLRISQVEKKKKTKPVNLDFFLYLTTIYKIFGIGQV